MPKCFYVATPGLGEIAQQTPILRQLHKNGFDVILLLRKAYSSAFDQLPYLYDIWPLESKDLFYKSENQKSFVVLSDAILLKMTSFHGLNEIISPMNFENNVLQRFQYRKKPNYFQGHSATYAFAYAAGVLIDDPTIDIGIHRQNVNKSNLGICVGADEQTRRFHPSAVDQIIAHFSTKCNIFLFGIDNNFSKQLHNKNYQNYLSNEFSPESLRITLNKLSEMGCFICPDTGLMHCAVAMGIPTVCVQSRTLIELLIHPKYFDFIEIYENNDLTCDKKCHGKLLGQHLLNRPSSIWEHALYKTPCAPHLDLTCIKEFPDTVQCMKRVDLKQLEAKVDKLLHV